jgi:phospholipase C
MRRAHLYLAIVVTLALVASTAGSVARATPAGVDSINHVVVFMQENRSFDSYFGHLKQYDPTLDVEAEPTTTANPNPLDPNASIAAFHQTNTCEVADLNHSVEGSNTEYDNGAMNGFTKANQDPNDPTGSRTMGYHTQAEIPYYYKLADTFAIGDRYFASELGPTFPNRFFLLTGTSFGHTTNDFPLDDPLNAFTQKTVFETLDAAHVSWRAYFAEVPFAMIFGYVRKEAAGHIFPIAQYFIDAAAGTLPQVSFVDPVFVGTNNTETDEHPTTNIQVGEKFSSAVINGLIQSPNWPSSALFFTYDEHGGFYDHVPPPAAVVPDSIPGDEKLDRYGFRVPVVVVSPFAKRHFVSHVVHDHTSILRFIETRFGLPALTARDAAADPMLEFFNFSQPTLAFPSLPDAPLDLQQIVNCQRLDLNRRGVGF